MLEPLLESDNIQTWSIKINLSYFLEILTVRIYDCMEFIFII